MKGSPMNPELLVNLNNGGEDDDDGGGGNPPTGDSDDGRQYNR